MLLELSAFPKGVLGDFTPIFELLGVCVVLAMADWKLSTFSGSSFVLTGV